MGFNPSQPRGPDGRWSDVFNGFKSLPPEVATDIQDTVSALYEKYPGLNGQVTFDVVAANKMGQSRYAPAKWDGDRILINRNAIKQEHEGKIYYPDDGSGRTRGYTDTVIHEMGHVAHRNVITNAAVHDYLRSEGLDTSMARSTLGQKFGTRYAGENADEFMAEVFLAYEQGEKNAKVRKIGKWMTKQLQDHHDPDALLRAASGR